MFTLKKLAMFLRGVKGEMAKVRWPNKSELIKYSIATLTIIIIFMAFFSLTDLGLAAIRTLVK